TPASTPPRSSRCSTSTARRSPPGSSRKKSPRSSPRSTCARSASERTRPHENPDAHPRGDHRRGAGTAPRAAETGHHGQERIVQVQKEAGEKETRRQEKIRES